jgi:mannose-6-phosphate isomerase-like protein (cupin superfamily)
MRIGETIEALNMGMRLTCRDRTPALKFDLWMRGDAAPIPMHVHPRQEERVTVVRGSVRSRTGNIDRVLKAGDVVVSPAGEAHTVGPAADEEVEMLSCCPRFAGASLAAAGMPVTKRKRVSCCGA